MNKDRFVAERMIADIEIRKGDWVKYSGMRFGSSFIFHGEGLFLGKKDVNYFEYFSFLGEDNKETVLYKCWDEHDRLFREVVLAFFILPCVLLSMAI